MFFEDTIFAPASPAGGAISVIRISGAGALALLRMFFIPKIADKDGNFEHRRMLFGGFYSPEGELIDTCSAVYYKAPASYTGEDSAEVFLHGSPAVMNSALALLKSGGARLAEAGEFTKRAFLNGKIELSGAEAVMDVINSDAELSRKAAVFQLEGGLGRHIDGIYDDITAALAHIYAVIDYPDEMGDDALSEARLVSSLSEMEQKLRALVKNGLASRVLRDGARVAILGEPNAGKSSLLNALLLRERAIVTPLAGTTRDTLEERADIKGIPVIFIDTAGIRATEDTVETLGVERAERELSSCDLALWLHQSDLTVTEGERAVYSQLKAKPHLIVFTKRDICPVTNSAAAEFYAGSPSVIVSSKTGEGLDVLRDKTAELLHPSGEQPIVTNSRHISALGGAADAIKSAVSAINAGLGLDCCATDLAEALRLVGSVNGRSADEDLINDIFSRFCVGK